MNQPRATEGRGQLYDSILDTIGNTPCIRINALAPEGVDLYVKAESFNPAASVKDRLAVSIIEEAERSGQFHVVGRWLGGTLTNFRTMKIGISRLHQLEAMSADGTFDSMTKKEALGLTREQARLEKFVGGIKNY